MTPFLQQVKAKAKKSPKRILFPEWFDERTLCAMAEILKEGTAQPILLGARNEVEAKARDFGITINWGKISVIDPANNPCLNDFTKKYPDYSRDDITKNINVFGAMMVDSGLVDGMISGATCSTSDTIRPAIHIIGTKEKFHKVSGFFFMVMPEKYGNSEHSEREGARQRRAAGWRGRREPLSKAGENQRTLVFADCAVIPEPSAHELADIALDTAETAKRFGLKPRVAMLSFSTNGSAKHPLADKVREATKMVRHRNPELIVEGEMQVDAALVPEICRRKFPSAKVHEGFNVLIFPSLEAGNIAYKLVERLGGAHAIGLIYQGLRKPVNDLSRGCSVQDIVDLAAFTTVEAQGEGKILNTNS